MFHPWIFPPTMPLGHCIEPHPCSQEAFPISRFTTSVLPSCLAKSKGVLPGNHSWHSNWPFPSVSSFNIPLKLIAVRTAEFDKWWLKRVETSVSICFILHTGSHGCQRHGWTLHPQLYINSCFNMFQTRSALRWSWQRHAPKSRLLNFKGTLKTGTWDDKSREIPCPLKLKKLTKCHKS